MEYSRFEIIDKKAYITLNRPEKRNALHPDLVSELKNALKESAISDKVKVVIIQAEGKAFCAGADLAYLQDLQRNTYEENLQDSNHLRELFELIYHFPKPVIAKVQGHALAGGCGLATVCDFIYAAEEAKFGYTEVKIGFVPAMVLVFLIRKIGESRASELLLSGELISASKAEKIGLIHEVCTAENLFERVENLAHSLIENNSGESMKLTKELIKSVQNLSLDKAMELASETNATARATTDCKKGISAFLNKEPIVW
ncbi:MAG: enoyl-CoA hydratase-related protein [Cyclobacteriaceae bacterium]